MIDINHMNALEVGKAAEHIVCAKAILEGYRAFLSDQGLPYDVILDVAGKLLRVQVRATGRPKNCAVVGRNPDLKYTFGARRRGTCGARRLSDSDCDLMAFVALDCMEVAFLPLADCGQTVQLFTRDKEFKSKYPRRKGRIDQYSISDALLAMEDTSRLLFKNENRVEYQGRFGSIASFAVERGLPASMVLGRVNKGGWSLAEALETPAFNAGQKRKRA